MCIDFVNAAKFKVEEAKRKEDLAKKQEQEAKTPKVAQEPCKNDTTYVEEIVDDPEVSATEIKEVKTEETPPEPMI